MSKTKIEYGERNWNFYPGCNGPDGIPCSYCWSRNRVLPRMKCPGCRTLKPHLHEERLNEPLHVKKPTRWLVCYTGDLFGPWVPADIMVYAFEVMRRCPQHTFLTLTKQPQNLARWSPFPDNCWVGVTVTDQKSWELACELLGNVKATVKYLSVEPLLGEIDASHWQPANWGINLVIIGQQTPIRPETTPKVEWIHEIVAAADKAGVKVWLKNNLRSVILPCEENYRMLGYYGGPIEYTRWTLRQEIPNGN